MGITKFVFRNQLLLDGTFPISLLVKLFSFQRSNEETYPKNKPLSTPPPPHFLPTSPITHKAPTPPQSPSPHPKLTVSNPSLSPTPVNIVSNRRREKGLVIIPPSGQRPNWPLQRAKMGRKSAYMRGHLWSDKGQYKRSMSMCVWGGGKYGIVTGPTCLQTTT